MRSIVLFLFLFTAVFVNAQHTVKGIVADSITKQLLAFATVKGLDEQKTVIASIDGRFSMQLKKEGGVKFSYSGHRTKTVLSSSINDTIFLAPLLASLEEVIIRSGSDKISRIINTAIEAKSINNPDQYAKYQCNIYYKMIVDITEYGNYNMDSIRKRRDSILSIRSAKRKQKASASKDTARHFAFVTPSHLFMTETYSKRLYKKPEQTQEIILASKFSGLSKTYFANMITDVLPFHVYSDYIPLNGINFINPIAKGWKGRYRFILENEIISGADTIFILSYASRNGTSFNSLKGLAYISSSGYAITHFTGANVAGSNGNMFVKFEHIYKQTNGRWFPQELNYDFGIQKVPVPYTQIVWNGRSVIDSFLFNETSSYRFDKAHPVKISPSVDRHEETEWNGFRKDTLSLREANTYKNMDSVMKAAKMEFFIYLSARAATGRIPIGKADVDVQRLFISNQYEGTRLGFGLYTNNKLSKYYSLGGWYGYGFKDKAPKYGGSFTIFPKGEKDNWLSASYKKDYRLTGAVTLHPELSGGILQTWLLQQIDEVKEYAITANIKPGYWEIRPSLSRTETGPLHYPFETGGKTITAFVANEASLGFRYAYAEKRVPFFEYYLSTGTKYPIAYASISRGAISATGYKATYYRALMAITFTKHINRWGADNYRLEGSFIQAANSEPLPRSLLLAGNGFRRSGVNFFASGGFITMRPFDFYSDRYVSFLYKHDLDKNLWNIKWSKPYLSLAHNLIYGGLQATSKLANKEIRSYNNGYHESGIILNGILKYNIGFADIQLNAGAYYHWQAGGNRMRNGVAVFGVSAGFKKPAVQ